MRTPNLAAMAATMIVAGAALAQTNVDSTNKFAWHENIGWTNWADANGGADGVRYLGAHVEGYVWAENAGWIDVGRGLAMPSDQYANTNNSNYGVNVDQVDGWLGGFAWAENLGWFNFDTPTLEAFGQRARYDLFARRLRGYAWGENVGWLNLDDSNAFVEFDHGCALADITTFGSCVPGASDGLVDLSDFSCYLSLWSLGGLMADITTTGSCVPGSGDGVVDLSDFSCYLAEWSLGCP
ncbi:MAG: GC-type dockerin domain-anchored protein [Planctomycetota bacterium]